MERVKSERLSSSNPEQKQYSEWEKIKSLTQELFEKLEQMGLPIREDLRIAVPTGDIEARRALRAFFLRNHPGLPNDKIEGYINQAGYDEFLFENQGHKLTSGCVFELIATIIFSKFLIKNGRFVVVRSSLYDDFNNQVDNLIFDRETNSVICTFDEVASLDETFLSKKRMYFTEKNIQGYGVDLKHGLIIRENKFIIEPLSSVPYIYLFLPPNILLNLIRNLKSNLGDFSEIEEKTFQFFVSSIQEQLQTLFVSIYVEAQNNPSLNNNERFINFRNNIENNVRTFIQVLKSFLK